MLSKYKIPNHAPKNPVSNDAAIGDVNRAYMDTVNNHRKLQNQNQNPRSKSNLRKMTHNLNLNKN